MATSLPGGRTITSNSKPKPPLSHRIPKNSWDSHMHVVEPQIFPLSPTAAYTPSHPHTLTQALTFESTLNIPNIVLVQPSIYASDNSCLLSALHTLGPSRARAVVGIDPRAPPSPETLKSWHTLGVRGARLNLKSVHRTLSKDELAAELRAYAAILRPLDWVLEVYIGLELAPLLVPLVPDLGVKFCIAHFGHPGLPAGSADGEASAERDPYALQGFAALVQLLGQGRTWVKCSAAYRIEADAEMPWTRAVGRELVRVAPGRLVFATDWPHTRFEGVDVKPFVEACLEWCGGEGEMADRLFRGNAEALWGVGE
ncbi:amidohydrolase 2 [Saccharata proteae CBS 121410]|uniref:Amidohydrolase 2 n=1 Tax=Saccharata proteae CBS 121410 TaxID=1314787 RepID=A0A9P4HP18_9PEZI|nr:amidohydrolase 2 [Saccharata proteae CBS 121410]